MFNVIAIRILLTLLVVALIAPACGSTQSPGDSTYAASVAPGTRAPVDTLEQTILKRLQSLPAGQSETIEGHTVTIGDSYSAASGRICRKIDISGARQEQSLVCLMAEGWAFVPKVMGAEASQT